MWTDSWMKLTLLYGQSQMYAKFMFSIHTWLTTACVTCNYLMTLVQLGIGWSRSATLSSDNTDMNLLFEVWEHWGSILDLGIRWFRWRWVVIFIRSVVLVAQSGTQFQVEGNGCESWYEAFLLLNGSFVELNDKQLTGYAHRST